MLAFLEGPNVWIILATLSGPILAVQAQKWLERGREVRGRKLNVFFALMANRRSLLSQQVIQALNAIDLVFYGRQVRGKHLQTRTEVEVNAKWQELLTHLSPDPPLTDDAVRNVAWNTTHKELFWNLLESIAKDLDFAFDRDTIKRGGYVPEAHAEAENEARAFRRSIIRVLGTSNEVPVRLVEGQRPPLPPPIPDFR